MLIGVVSDTHGHFQPGLRKLFRGVERILHAGDIGSPAVLVALERLAPVTAVRGNVDSGSPLAGYPLWQEMEVEGHRLLLIHRGRGPGSDPELARILQRTQPEVVVYGHTHRAEASWVDGVYYFNPGAGGRPRFGVAPTAGLLLLEPGRVEGTIHSL